MSKPLDTTIKAILDKYKINPKEALWDSHGTWVMYHRHIEKVAADNGIIFDAPQVLEANGPAKSVAICVVGRMGERVEWSIGEAAPSNNKNSYPYAMAEKRAKDRVALKLIGLHGLVYSEDEMPTNGNGAFINDDQMVELTDMISEVGADLKKFCKYMKVENLAELPAAKFNAAKSALEAKRSSV
jgi:hypothetical protein